MSIANFLPVVLAGGVGSRLWPASRKSFPKQFLDILGDGRSLLVSSIDRNLFDDAHKGFVLTTADQTLLSKTFVRRAGMEEKFEVCSEPQGKNSGPAVLLACKYALSFSKDPDVVLGIFSADHHIQKEGVYRERIEQAVELASKGKVVTLGITPSYPATSYGYIRVGQSTDDYNSSGPVESFIEKPDLEKAKSLLEEKNVFWNAGIFIFQAKVMLDLFKKHQPAMFAEFEKLNDDFSNIAEVYEGLEDISFDYAVMEHIESDLWCLPSDIGWSDVGSWEEVSRLNQKGVKVDELAESQGNEYLSLGVEPKRVVALGVEDTIAVETPDALLLMKKGMGQHVRQAYKMFSEETEQNLTNEHRFEERPWGRFEILLDTAYFKSKRIVVRPGQRLSYQSHNHRAEHWVVVKGEAEVTLNDEVHVLGVNEHIHIPLKAKHRVANKGKENLEFIEVQTGSYFGEDDIIRYSDDYSRV